ncbi:hypothetical protein GCM10009865_00150 [Aeromicrobium ponti]
MLLLRDICFVDGDNCFVSFKVHKSGAFSHNVSYFFDGWYPLGRLTTKLPALPWIWKLNSGINDEIACSPLDMGVNQWN